MSYLHYQHNHWFEAKLILDFIAFTWKIHGILCHKRSENPASALTHFEIFITKICMKVPGIWHKKPWKTWNLGPKTLRKPGILVFEKKVGTLCILVYCIIPNRAGIIYAILISISTFKIWYFGEKKWEPWKYSKTFLQWPPLRPNKWGHCRQVVFLNPLSIT